MSLLLRSTLNARVVLPSEIVAAAKTAVNAIRHALSHRWWTRAHYELLENLVYNIALTGSNKHYKTGVVERSGLIEICFEVMLSSRPCGASVALAVAAAHRLCQVGTQRAETIALLVKTYVRCATHFSHRALEWLDFGRIVSVLRRADGVAECAVIDAATALMADANSSVRVETLITVGRLVNPDAGVQWRAGAAESILAPIVTKALGDVHAHVRAEAATLTQWIMDHCPAAITPDHIECGISAVIPLVRAHPELRDTLHLLIGKAPVGVLESVMSRLDEAVSQENRSDVIFGVFHVARHAGDQFKDRFAEQFGSFLKRASVKPNEELGDCYACYEQKANVIATKGCEKWRCGACACTKAHFCSRCMARIFLESVNEDQVACPTCRKTVCIDDLRVLEETND